MSLRQGLERLAGAPIGAMRAIFGVYAVAMAVATHWPKLELPPAPIRTDIVVHMGAFGLWATLCALCRWFGPAFCGRNLTLAGVVSLVYSAIDEATQGLPGVNRVVGLDDALANAAGVTLAIALLWALGRGSSGGSVSVAAPGEPMSRP